MRNSSALHGKTTFLTNCQVTARAPLLVSTAALALLERNSGAARVQYQCRTRPSRSRPHDVQTLPSLRGSKWPGSRPHEARAPASPPTTLLGSKRSPEMRCAQPHQEVRAGPPVERPPRVSASSARTSRNSCAGVALGGVRRDRTKTLFPRMHALLQTHISFNPEPHYTNQQRDKGMQRAAARPLSRPHQDLGSVPRSNPPSNMLACRSSPALAPHVRATRNKECEHAAQRPWVGASAGPYLKRDAER